ncbi:MULTISPECIES: hypothetical protein [Anaerotruncus]|uniref:Lipoprotein n=1 Tax=Anaerotruncus colihominis TaxID=169435 RepID=A0A845T517_9FIRM|nr:MULTISPECIES: hypothetical protein [Anaerotruncus]MCI8493631.1 hypothetical protein [Anaerotruncus sp.]MCR2023946.1 hypothetical protein [Anaerotruncus colihominis]NBI79645.1 hypothetical protein [Anaerotruncus colihominis]NDO39501.1 hypothetical protein [Anaerotruncus colihominis]
MKKKLGLAGVLTLLTVLCLVLSACSSKSDKAYPVVIEGTEIIVGQTKAGALFDAGFTMKSIAPGMIGAADVSPSQPMDANSYYTGIYMLKDDVKRVTLALVTEKESVSVQNAVIASVKVDSELDHPLEGVSFDGVALTDLTPSVLKEHVPDAKDYEDGTSSYFYGSSYSVCVNYIDGKPASLEVKRNYDVDYSS